MKKSLGIYVHIPFCIKKCNYCDFCSFSNKSGELMKSYTVALCKKIRESENMCSEHAVNTVYFGGGTPTLLPIEEFRQIFSAVTESFYMTPDCEITVECNPATADKGYLSALRSMGVNRLSIGLQSTHESELRLLGRVHTFEDFVSIFTDARAAGFDNISADLMYGIPDQTAKSFRESLSTLAKIGPEHISVYGLKIEEGTFFHKIRDTLSLPDEDTEYEMYLSCTEILGSYGYEKYEISNFALKGRHSRHNVRYWHCEEYLGFGVAAHSFFEGERFGNSRDISAFIRGEDITEERYTLTDRDNLNEFIMLSLRLGEGLSLSELSEKTGMTLFEFYPKARTLIDSGFMQIKDERLSFSDKGFFVSNSILSDMLDFE